MAQKGGVIHLKRKYKGRKQKKKKTGGEKEKKIWKKDKKEGKAQICNQILLGFEL